MAGAEVVSWTSGAAGVVLRVAPDEKLAPLVRFWIDGRPARIRAQAASAGGVAKIGYDDGSSRGRAWAEGGRTLILLSRGLSARELDDVASGLRPAAPAEWEKVRGRVLDLSSDDAIKGCSDRDGPLVALGRQEAGRYRWTVGLRTGRASSFSFCATLLTPDDRSLASAGGARLTPGKLSISTLGEGGARDPIGLFLVGVAPPRTARVQAVTTDGRTVDAELADQGPGPGERWFAVFVEGNIRFKPAIVALDQSGAQLGRVPGGDPA
jgi:hypothetical protein